ncbi:MAG: hypothetical protein AAGI72_15270 [Pseudomonadota bacterium]
MSDKATDYGELPPPPTISKAQIAARLEVTENIVDSYMKRHWVRGVHYTVRGGRARFNWREIDRWTLDDGPQESSPEEKGSKSKSGEVGSGSTARSSSATHSTQLPLPPQLSIVKTSSRASG